MASTDKKLILVIGATGGQGVAIIDALLAPSSDGKPSPYAIRALTRDPSNYRAQSLAEKGVECVRGSVHDLDSVHRAFEGCYGAYINTDGFSIGEMKEVFYGMRIFEIAKTIPTMRHYVWAGLDYVYKIGGYNPIHRVGHHDGKGRVSDWLKAQPSVVSDNDMSWTVLGSGPYMDMLNTHMFGPLNIRKDGTYVFATPVGDGHVPMIALEDLGVFNRWVFDHRAETSAAEINCASDIVGWDYLVATFTRVTGKPAVYKRLTLDEWFSCFEGVDRPLAGDIRKEAAAGAVTGPQMTTRQNFSGWWSMWRDDVLPRDMDALRKIHPGLLTVEAWMRKHKYEGLKRSGSAQLLKNNEEKNSPFNLTQDKERLDSL